MSRRTNRPAPAQPLVAAPTPGIAGERNRSRMFRMTDCSVDGEREHEAEGRARAGGALELDRAAVGFGDDL
jgi:hypothetical protein